MTSDRKLKQAARAYMTEHDVNYTTARRAVLAQRITHTDEGTSVDTGTNTENAGGTPMAEGSKPVTGSSALGPVTDR